MAGRGYMPRAQTQEWETPRDLFDRLWEEFGPFECDPCCRTVHYTAQRVLGAGGLVYVPPGGLFGQRDVAPGVAEDGLLGPWRGAVYMNPPYGEVLAAWVTKAVREVEAGNARRVVGLVPARTDTRWWQRYVLEAASCTPQVVPEPLLAGGWEIACHSALRVLRFLPGRLRFGGAANSATFPSVIVVWEMP